MTKNGTTPRPYKAHPMSANCCGFVHNPDWGTKPGVVKLLHCTEPVAAYLTVADSGEVEIKACCDNHAAQLRTMAKAGRIEILNDESRESEAAA